MTDNTPHAHSVYGPSGSKRWIACPASIQMQDAMPKQEETYNFFAEEGTAAHELAADCLIEEVKAEAKLGKIYNKEFEVDQAMATQVNKYLDYVNGAVTWDARLDVELRVSLEHIADGVFGTADAVIHADDYLEVIDLKYGRGIVVEPQDNTQLMLYASGVLKKHHYDDEQKVKLTIVQPRAPHKDGPVRSTIVTVAQIKDLERICTRAIMQSKEENPPFGPTDEGCRWCAANPVCTHYANYVLESMQLEWSEFAETPRNFNLLEANSMDSSHLANVLKHSKSITSWLSGLADYATNQLTQGKEVPGYKLVYGRSIRRWKNSSEAENILLEAGVEEDTMNVTKFKTAPQMEKALDKEHWEMVLDLVEKPQGKITLAPVGDGRRAIDPNQDAVDDWS